MWRNDIKYKYMFTFPLKNLARKGLSHPSCNQSLKVWAVAWNIARYWPIFAAATWLSYSFSSPFPLTISDVHSQSLCRLVRPAAGHITDGVATSTQHEQWQVVLLHELHTLPMTCTHRKPSPYIIDGSVEDYRNSSTLAMKLPQVYTKPLISTTLAVQRYQVT